MSCGYTYELCEENGQYIQRKIRGNHVAVVDAGRAGPRVSIKDSVGTPPPGSKDRTAADGNRPVQKSGRFSSNERRKAMNKRNLCFAKMMTRMARDGEAEALAEMIGEILEEETEAVLPSPAPDTPEEPVIVEAPEDQPVLVDCGPEILAALNRIIGLLSAGAGADCGRPGCQRDGDPDDATAEAAGEAAEAVEALAEAAAEAVAEAVETAAESPEPDAPDDPVGELIAEILEGENGAEGGPSAESVQGEILSWILEPEADEDSPSEPDSRAEDALRAALAVFRPHLQRMSSGERKRFNADVAARMRKLTRGAAPSGRSGSYAALRRAAARDRSARDLGRRIMASRNANMKR